MSALASEIDPLEALANREYFVIHRIVRKKGTNRVQVLCENVQDWRTNQDVKIVVVVVQKRRITMVLIARVIALNNTSQTILEYENPSAQPILPYGYVLRHKTYLSRVAC